MTRSFTASAVAAFRLTRQHLIRDRSATAIARRDGRSASSAAKAPAHRSAERLVDVVRDVAGIQAQVMSAAELAIWTRRRSTTHEELQRALWQTRDLVRTSAMRLTLHVIAARDLATYIAALKPMAMATLHRWHARVGARPEQVRAMIATVVESFKNDEPQTQQELIARARKRAGRGIRTWLDHAWSAVRPAVIDGAIVYGPPRGAEATFVRAEAWIGPPRAIAAEDARGELLRRFLSAFGPATARDFAKWSGLKTSDAAAALAAVEDELVDVAVEDARGWLLRRDLTVLAGSQPDPHAVHLLPAFDSLLLAHATKAHLVDPRFYKRVYRTQGWISPTVLQGGRIVGVWFQQTAGKQVALDVQLFAAPTRALRDAIAAEADALSVFLGARCVPKFTAR